VREKLNQKIIHGDGGKVLKSSEPKKETGKISPPFKSGSKTIMPGGIVPLRLVIVLNLILEIS
jgi:hypothetical protein